MTAEAESVTLSCRVCHTSNRFPVRRALEDLGAARCGSCKTRLLRVSGEPLADLDATALSHPWDKQALEKLQSVPYADKLISSLYGATFDKLRRFYLMAGAVRVGDRQMPRLWKLYLEAAGRINVDPPPLFVIQQPEMNAFAIGAGDPMVVVTTELLDKLDDRALVGVLGHELTHVALGHVLYRTVAILLFQGALGALSKFLGIASALALPLRMALLRWVQMAELSADRGELVASGSAETFVRAHLQLAGGSVRFADGLDVAAFVDQADDAEKLRDDNVMVWAMELLDGASRTHPLPAWRVHHGLAWARTPAFFDLLAGAPHVALEDAR